MKIIKELEKLLPPLEEGEYNALLDSIRENGQEDPIKLGRIDGEEPCIVDGHNRYRICQKLGIDPTYSENVLDFADIFDAKLWMIDRQLERRNLNNFQRAEMHLKKKDVFAEQAKVRQKATQFGSTVHQNSGEPSGKDCKEWTDRILAKQSGISHDTIHRVSKIMEKANEEDLEALRKGDKTINRVYTAIKSEEIRAANEAIKAANPIPKADGKYQTIVIDPPWPMEKINRDKSPEDTGFGYPTMTEEELTAFPLQDWADDQCHLYLWTTQKFF